MHKGLRVRSMDKTHFVVNVMPNQDPNGELSLSAKVNIKSLMYNHERLSK